MRMEISVILPVYGEESSIVEVGTVLFQEIGLYIKEMIVIYSPKSPNKTIDFCKKLQSKYPDKVRLFLQQENRGLGRAIRQGFREASGNYVLTIDSDGELDPRTAKFMVKKAIREQMNMVVASRWIKGGGVEGYSLLKKILTKSYSLVMRVLFMVPIHDLSLGYKLIHRSERFQNMRFEGKFHDIATETTLRPIRWGFRVSEFQQFGVKNRKENRRTPL